MPSAFGKLLQRTIKAQRPKLSVKRWSERVGTSNGQIFNIIAGRRTPDLTDVERWADDLQLTGEERELFLDLAAVAHIPDEIAQDRVAKVIEGQHVQLKKLQALSKRIAEFEKHHGA